MSRRLVFAVLGAIALGGCAGDRFQRGEGRTMQIEVLGFSGCPNTPVMRDRVAEAAGGLGMGAQVVYIDQESLAESDLRRGYPTPTVLVEGVDLFGLPVPSTPAMGCRVYAGGLPTVEEIASRLASRR